MDIFTVMAMACALLLTMCCAISYGFWALKWYRHQERIRRIREQQRRRESFKIYTFPKFTELDLGNGVKEIRERTW